jgi:hypothetical protein
MDLYGPFRVPGPQEERYCLSVIDDGTRYGSDRFLHRKGDVADAAIEVQELYQTQMNAKTQALRFDNEEEFLNLKLQSYASSQGIRLETTTPQQKEWLKEATDVC